MLTGIHFLLTYKCDLECDHCFLYCGPGAGGTFTLEQVHVILREAAGLGTVKRVYFEGGEPFLFYPLLLEGVKAASDMGFEVGVVTNAYWGTSVEDAKLWLVPLRELHISDVSISDDAFHYDEGPDAPPRVAVRAAEELGLPVGKICIEEPVKAGPLSDREKGAAVVGGGAMFRGRAVERLTDGLPLRPWAELVECPYEDLENPGRVHVDSYGNVHLCQGLLMGNAWKTAFSSLVNKYKAAEHPIAGPLVLGGPAALVKEYAVPTAEGYVDECHLCWTARLGLMEKFPEYLGPRQVYGLE